MKLKIYGNTPDSHNTQLFDEDFRLIIAGPTGCGKTNTLMNILCQPLAFFDQVFVFTRTPEQSKMAELQDIMGEISKKAKYEVLQVLSPEEIDIDEFHPDSRKIVVFDDLLHEPPRTQEKIAKHFTLGRHQKISPIYLSQSFFGIPTEIRLNSSHMILYPPSTTKHLKMIGRETMVDPAMFASLKPFDFLFLNRNKKSVAKNFDEIM